jgi:FdhD protein
VEDHLATESPLEIRVEGRSVAVIMRTPGHDRALCAGFLLTEGLIRSKEDVFEISVCPSSASAGGNVVDVVLRQPERFSLEKLTRHVFTSSSCGICGKASLEAALQAFPPLEASPPEIDPAVLFELPERQKAAQETFKTTGGLHASALFTLQGDIVSIFEDVGRHNALDKLLGHALLQGDFPLREHILLLSGRVSFELMQKSLAARIPVIAALGAPSSLAVDFARTSGQRLYGFLKSDRVNAYS